MNSDESRKQELLELERKNNSWFYKNFNRRWYVYSFRMTLFYSKLRPSWKRNFPIVAIGIALFFSLIFVYNFPRSSYASWHLTSTGQIGDTVGGLTAPVIGLLNAVLLWWTLKIQNDQINEQNNTRDYEKRIELIDQNVRRCKLSIMVSRRGAFGHSERVKYKGIEALIRATDFVKAPETINALSLDNIEWRSFLKSVEGVYRNMSVAVGMLNTQDKLNFSSWEPNHKLDQDNLDIVEQTKEVLEFASAYISFMDDKRNDQLFEHMCNEHAYQFMKNKYGWASFYMASIEEDIQDEPADPDGDGPED